MNCNDTSCTPTQCNTEPTTATAVAELPTVAPRVDAWSDDEGDRICLDLPGVPRESVELHLDGTVLTVTAVAASAEALGAPLHAEWRPVRYERRFELPPRSDVAAITARLELGVLEIVVPRRAAERRRTIPVLGVGDDSPSPA